MLTKTQQDILQTQKNNFNSTSVFLILLITILAALFGVWATKYTRPTVENQTFMRNQAGECFVQKKHSRSSEVYWEKCLCSEVIEK